MVAQLVGLALLWVHLCRAAVFLVEKERGAFRLVPTAARHAKLALQGDGVQQRVLFFPAPVWPARLGAGATRQELGTSARARHALRASSVPWMLQPQRALASPVKLEDTSQSRLLAIRCCAFHARLETIVTWKVLPVAATALQANMETPWACRLARHAQMGHGRLG